MLNIILFGQLAELAGAHSVALNGIRDTDQLQQAIAQLHPAMAGISYMVAVDKKVIKNNTIINETNSVALLPAFSGG